MAFKFVVLCCALAVANAGLIGAPAAGLISAPAAVTYSAAPAVSHVSYSSPLVSYGAPLSVAAPALTTQHQNILRSPGNLQQISTYSKTIDTPFSSVSKSDVRVSNPGLVATAAYPAAAYSAAAYPAAAYPAAAYPAAYHAAPAVAYTKTLAAPVAAPGFIGAAYSAAPAVSHMSYSNGLGITYGW